MANWVRFADTKATILAGALGVTVTLFMANAKTIASAIKLGYPAAAPVGILACVALTTFCYTLYWLMRAIAPKRDVNYVGLNRFAWPTLVDLRAADVVAHADAHDLRGELWQQVVDLSGMAQRKFDACNRAIGGFTVFAVIGVACVVTAVGFTT